MTIETDRKHGGGCVSTLSAPSRNHHENIVWAGASDLPTEQVIEIHHKNEIKTGHLQMLGNGIYVSTRIGVTEWVLHYRITACNFWSYGGLL
jgi:hypothetical protein